MTRKDEITAFYPSFPRKRESRAVASQLRAFFWKSLGGVVKLDSRKCGSFVSVIPAKAGIQKRCRPVPFFLLEALDSGFRRNDGAI